MTKTEVVSKPNFIEIDNKIVRTFDSGVVGLVKNGAKYLKNISPVKTGKMRDSIGNNDSEIWTSSKYYKYVNDGTKPHKIEGNPFLKFQINGVTIITRSVNHPGTKPQKMTEKTIKYIESEIPQIEKQINRVI